MEAMKLLTVFGLGAVSLSTAIITGLAIGLPPVVVGSTAASGSLIAVLAIGLSGERVRAWLLRRYGTKDHNKQQGRLHRIWDRYGVVGLGLLIPLLFNTPLGAALAIALGVPARRLLFWISLGIVLWSVIVTIAGALGLAGIQVHIR